MKVLAIALVVVVASWFVVRQMVATNGPDLLFEGDAVSLSTRDLDVSFDRGEPFEGTFMLFGGGYLDHPNTVANVTLAGLSVRDARPIYRQYPDFHRCASQGADLAKSKIQQLDMVPADGEVLDSLRSSLDDFEGSLRSGGDRVCLQVRGSRLKMTSAEVREVGESVAHNFPSRDFYLVDSADRVECRTALSGS